LKDKRNLKKPTENNKKETTGSINNSIKTKEQKEIEFLMDSVIYENREALKELAKQ
jgi:hypothetical protein